MQKFKPGTNVVLDTQYNGRFVGTVSNVTPTHISIRWQTGATYTYTYCNPVLQSLIVLCPNNQHRGD